jgi:hypothetical protein
MVAMAFRRMDLVAENLGGPNAALPSLSSARCPEGATQPNQLFASLLLPVGEKLFPSLEEFEVIASSTSPQLEELSPDDSSAP